MYSIEIHIVTADGYKSQELIWNESCMTNQRIAGSREYRVVGDIKNSDSKNTLACSFCSFIDFPFVLVSCVSPFTSELFWHSLTFGHPFIEITSLKANQRYFRQLHRPVLSWDNFVWISCTSLLYQRQGQKIHSHCEKAQKSRVCRITCCTLICYLRQGRQVHSHPGVD